MRAAKVPAVRALIAPEVKLAIEREARLIRRILDRHDPAKRRRPARAAA